MNSNHQISSLQHPIVKHCVKLRSDSEYRYAMKTLLLEGSKPIFEVPHSVKTLFYTDSYQGDLSHFSCEKWMVTSLIMEKISGLQSPEGVVAEVYLPPFVRLNHQHSVLVLDAINDPGNLGTLMRTALAFGWDGIYFLGDCCDPFNEKVLRAARGAHFKISLGKGTLKDLIELQREGGFVCYVADLEGTAPENVVVSEKMILVMGNEAHGPSQEAKHLCQSVTLPMNGQMESLNVAIAGGILLYLFRKCAIINDAMGISSKPPG